MARRKKHGTGSVVNGVMLPPGFIASSDLDALDTCRSDSLTDLPSLSRKETDELERCEATIGLHRNAFIEVGAALTTIRNERLYRATHKTFEAYCRERWDIGRKRAYQLIDSSSLAPRLSSVLDKDELSERAVLELLPIQSDDEAMRKALGLARKSTPGKLTAKVVKAAVAKVRGEELEDPDPEPVSDQHDIDHDTMSRLQTQLVRLIASWPKDYKKVLAEILVDLASDISEDINGAV